MARGKARQAPTRSSARLRTSTKSLDESAHSLPEEGTRLDSSSIPVDNDLPGLSSGTSPSISELHSTEPNIPHGQEASTSRTRRDAAATLSPVQRKSLKRSHKQANSGQTSGSKGASASSPIHNFFQHPSKEFRKDTKHVQSTKTRPFHPFDQHLHPDLRLNEVVFLDTLPATLSQYCDDIIEESADYLHTAGPPPKPDNEQRRPRPVQNEDQLVDRYIASNQSCLQVASGLLFKKGWADIFSMTKPNKIERQEGIADVLISIDPKEGGKHLTAKQRSDLKLLRKYLLDVFVTIEFKSLVAAPHIFEDLPRLEGKFPWSTCEERTDDNEKSTTCRASSNAHRVSGRLQTTGRPTSPDSSIVLQLIEDARSREQPSKRLKVDSGNSPKPAKQNSVYACQQIWTQLVVEDASVAIFSSGNEEFVAIRDRAKQTLYLSPMIKCTSNSSITHSKILVACILLGFNDALDRARQLESMLSVPATEVSPGYRINVDKLPFYVKTNLVAELYTKVRSEQAHPQNHDQAIISLFEKCSEIPIRFHDNSTSGRLGGPSGVRTWHLQKRGSHCDAIGQPERSGRLFLDFNYEPQLDKKVFVVYLGLVEEDSPNASKYYSKPLYIKLTRNAPLSKMLEVEHNNYVDLRAKGVDAIVQVYGLFENPDLPNHRFLILESGGKPVTLETTAHCKRFKDLYLDALDSFHNMNISIGNIMNDHIVMNEERKVSVISLAHISHPATSAIQRDEVKAFQNAIRASASSDITSVGPKEASPTGTVVSSSESG